MGRPTKNESNTSGSTVADAPVVEPVKVDVKVDGAKDASDTKAKRTRVFRGQECEILKTTKNVRTGAIYDLIHYKRKVTNRHTGEVSEVFVGRKLRRPGTGVVAAPREVEIEE
jgi:hypothetical protein